MQIVSFETICIKCQNLFSGENKKNISKSFNQYSLRVLSTKRKAFAP